MPNIKFSYLYRDGSNYKRFSHIIFSNPDDIDLQEFAALVKSKLIFETWFYADKWKLREIFTKYIDFRVDPTWHEFENIEYTDDATTAKFSLGDFTKFLSC
jgi:hypothetical protein